MLWFFAIMGTSMLHLGFAWRNPTTLMAEVRYADIHLNSSKEDKGGEDGFGNISAGSQYATSLGDFH